MALLLQELPGAGMLMVSEHDGAMRTYEYGHGSTAYCELLLALADGPLRVWTPDFT
jgi:hypothetical protein